MDEFSLFEDILPSVPLDPLDCEETPPNDPVPVDFERITFGLRVFCVIA
jgi:hypothetical protein